MTDPVPSAPDPGPDRPAAGRPLPAGLRVAHTADLGPDELLAARALLYRAFDDMTEDDWEHCLGGLHVLVRQPDGLVTAHAAVVQRRLLHRGRAWRVGYVEGVAVEAGLRRHGQGAAVMREAARVVAGGYEFGALASTDEGIPFYRALGWQLWRGPTSALTPVHGVTRTPDADDCVFVLPGAERLDLTDELTCDWRDGDPW